MTENNDTPEKFQQIYYLLAYDVNAGKWMNADHVLGFLTNGLQVYQADGPGEAGEWIALDAHVPELVDQDFENTQVLSRFLKEQNGLTEEN